LLRSLAHHELPPVPRLALAVAGLAPVAVFPGDPGRRSFTVSPSRQGQAVRAPQPAAQKSNRDDAKGQRMPHVRLLA
jgi:hypothetical protein